MKDEEVRELLYQALETELGGVQVYRTALRCVVNKDLKKEWEEYLEQTENHVRIVENVFTRLGLDPEAEPPGRLVVRHLGESLVKAMEMALEAGKPAAAQLVAAECVVLAETKDHLNWELIGELAKKAKGEQGSALKEAYKEVEEEEDEHLYHTAGWSRELWIETLGMPAVLPPPEEEKEVKTAIGAARAKLARQDLRRPAMAKQRTTSRSRAAADPSTTRSKTGRFPKDHTNTRTRGSDTARRSRTAEERKSGSRLGTRRD
jgi:rubrerythrin